VGNPKHMGHTTVTWQGWHKHMTDWHKHNCCKHCLHNRHMHCLHSRRRHCLHRCHTSVIVYTVVVTHTGVPALIQAAKPYKVRPNLARQPAYKPGMLYVILPVFGTHQGSRQTMTEKPDLAPGSQPHVITQAALCS